MSDSADFRLMQNLIFNNGNGTSADAAAATLRIGSMIFSSWLRSLVSIIPYARHHNPLLKTNHTFYKKKLEKKKWS